MLLLILFFICSIACLAEAVKKSAKAEEDFIKGSRKTNINKEMELVKYYLNIDNNTIQRAVSLAAHDLQKLGYYAPAIPPNAYKVRMVGDYAGWKVIDGKCIDIYENDHKEVSVSAAHRFSSELVHARGKAYANEKDYINISFEDYVYKKFKWPETAREYKKDLMKFRSIAMLKKNGTIMDVPHYSNYPVMIIGRNYSEDGTFISYICEEMGPQKRTIKVY